MASAEIHHSNVLYNQTGAYISQKITSCLKTIRQKKLHEASSKHIGATTQNSVARTIWDRDLCTIGRDVWYLACFRISASPFEMYTEETFRKS